MKCKDQALYQHTLSYLHARGVQFCVIGTFGLGLHHPAFPVYPVKDCDIMVANDTENLNKLVKALKDLGWELYLWEEAIIYPLSLEKLSGKFYIRAVQQDAILDATYECAYISWPEFARQASWIEGIPVASIFHILHLKKIRSTPKDQAIIEKVQALLKLG